MPPGIDRPLDEQYWVRCWSKVLFAGDLFVAVPFVDQPFQLYEDDTGQAGRRHYVGQVSTGYGVMISPTCDLINQLSGGASHPFRVFVPVVPASDIVEQVPNLDLGLIRGRDRIRAYMYLPPIPGFIEEESLACLYRPMTLTDELLRSTSERIAQLGPEARRQLKLKLIAYWTRMEASRDELPLYEQDEDSVRADSQPASPYDADEVWPP